MKRNALTSVALFIVIMMMGACGNNVWDELPSRIEAFVTEYFPFGEVESYKTTANGSVLKIKNGATLAFDSDYEWTEVNGNGSTLPQNFLFDELPPVLYGYIDSMERTEDVYSVSRYPDKIMVEFHNSEIEYDRATETITYPAVSSNIGLRF